MKKDKFINPTFKTISSNIIRILYKALYKYKQPIEKNISKKKQKKTNIKYFQWIYKSRNILKSIPLTRQFL